MEVYRFGFVDGGRHTTEPFLFGLWDAETIEGVLDVVRNIVPVFLRGVRGTKEVSHVVKIDVVEFSLQLPQSGISCSMKWW